MITYDIDDEFEDFMRRVFPTVKEHSTQYIQSRRVFFAAVASFYYYAMNELTTVSENDGLKELEKINEQIEGFRKRIGYNV